MELYFYIASAIVTAILVSLFPGFWMGIAIAWFAWCGGVMFDRLGFTDRIIEFFKRV